MPDDFYSGFELMLSGIDQGQVAGLRRPEIKKDLERYFGKRNVNMEPPMDS